MTLVWNVRRGVWKDLSGNGRELLLYFPCKGGWSRHEKLTRLKEKFKEVTMATLQNPT